jgi:hypothetical protein
MRFNSHFSRGKYQVRYNTVFEGGGDGRGFGSLRLTASTVFEGGGDGRGFGGFIFW